MTGPPVQDEMDLAPIPPQRPKRVLSSLFTAVEPLADDEDILESPDAVRAGVQIVLRGGQVRDVLVAGRPASPFTGTMGDHVTAFGAHVVNLRRAMYGRDLRNARKGMTDLVHAMKTLPGYKLITPGDSAWRRQQAALEAALRESPADSEDAQVAELQRIASLYLEVREGIPLSLLNTRSLTADSGKGHGEAKWLPLLADGGVPQKQTKRGRLSGSGATQEQIEIALGLFDHDASAMLTFNHATNQPEYVTMLLPAHSDVAAVLRTDPPALTEMLARQHAMSLFPNSGDTAHRIAGAVAEKLTEAHTARAKADGAEWKRRLEVTLKRIAGAVHSMETEGYWLKQQSGTPGELESALRDVGLLTAAAPAGFRDELKSLYAIIPGAVERVLDIASIPGHPDRSSLVRAIKKFLSQFQANLGSIRATEPARLSSESLTKTEGALRELQEAGDVSASRKLDGSEEEPQDPEVLPESESPETPELPAKKRLVEESQSTDSDKDSDSGGPEPQRRVLPRSWGGFGASERLGPQVASSQEKDSARTVLQELSSGIGNSCTVALRLHPDGRIELVGLRGRPPSPFKGTMGAHATAWVVWVNAVENLLRETTIEEAGENLVRFAEGIIADAEAQRNLPNNAQNGQRRLNARWSDGSLDAWRTVLKEHEAKPWTVSSVQIYAQAVLAFVNMLPGTTRTGKNTDGHAEARAWSMAKLSYASGNPEMQRRAFEGAGLFDASANAWVRSRHFALMEVALGGRECQAWKAWPKRT
jgi:hypothetical protein